MNYIELINRFWVVNMEHSFTGNEAKLYYFLLHTSNTLYWKNPFRQSDRQIMLGTGISQNSIKSARNKLAQSGLIIFKSGKSGNRFNISNKTEYTLTVSINDTDTDTHNDVAVSEIDTGKDTATGGHTVPAKVPATGGIYKQKETKLPFIKKEIDLNFIPAIYKPLVDEFIRYRKQDLKKPFTTQRGIKSFFEELKKLSDGNIVKATELVNHAKNKEWKTVFPIRKEKVSEKFRNESIVEYDEKL